MLDYKICFEEMQLVYDNNERIFWFKVENGNGVVLDTDLQRVNNNTIDPLNFVHIANEIDLDDSNIDPIFVVTDRQWYIIKGYTNDGKNMEDLNIISPTRPDEQVVVTSYRFRLPWKKAEKSNSYINDRVAYLAYKRATLSNY